jgi:hypothetical protein
VETVRCIRTLLLLNKDTRGKDKSGRDARA